MGFFPKNLGRTCIAYRLAPQHIMLKYITVQLTAGIFIFIIVAAGYGSNNLIVVPDSCNSSTIEEMNQSLMKILRMMKMPGNLLYNANITLKFVNKYKGDVYYLIGHNSSDRRIAIEYYEKALEHNIVAVKREYIYFRIAASYYLLNQIDDSIRMVKKALESNNRQPEYLLLLATLYANRGNYIEAIDLLCEINMDSYYIPGAHVTLGMLYEEENQINAAIQEYKKEIERYVNHEQPTYESKELAKYAFQSLKRYYVRIGDDRMLKDLIDKYEERIYKELEKDR